MRRIVKQDQHRATSQVVSSSLLVEVGVTIRCFLKTNGLPLVLCLQKRVQSSQLLFEYSNIGGMMLE